MTKNMTQIKTRPMFVKRGAHVDKTKDDVCGPVW